MIQQISVLEDFSLFIRNGASIKQTDGAKGDPITRIETIANRTVNLTKCGYADISSEDYEKYLLQEGDILISHINSTKHLGKCAIYEGDEVNIIHGMNLLCLRVDENKAHAKYVFYMLSSSGFLEQLPKITKNSVNQSSFNVKSFQKLNLPLPPLETQKKIAAVLEKADQLRKDCKQMEQELNSLAQSVFIDMFGDPVTNPKGWGSSSLEAEMQFLTSGSRGWAKHYDDEGDSIFIRIQNVLKDKLRLNDIQKISPPNTQEAIRTKVQDGDILLSITADLGRACVVRNIESDSYISQHLALIRIKESNLVPEFLSAFLISPAGIGQFEQKNKGGTKAGLNFSDIRSIKVLLPPKELQVKFKKIKEDLEQEIIQLNQTAKVYDDLFNSLMQKAFKGELSL